MKKLIIFIIALMFMCSLFTIVAFAEDGVQIPGAVDTILDRLFEWWEVNKTEILAATSGIGAVASAAFVWCKSKKPFLSLISSAKTSDERESELIKGYNALAEAYNKQSERFDEIDKEFKTLRGEVKSLKTMVARKAKVLQTVYANSVLPQGVKDIVSLECAECMKDASDAAEVSVNEEHNEGESA